MIGFVIFPPMISGMVICPLLSARYFSSSRALYNSLENPAPIVILACILIFKFKWSRPLPAAEKSSVSIRTWSKARAPSLIPACASIVLKIVSLACSLFLYSSERFSDKN